jgi:site-specific recombinase XerD
MSRSPKDARRRGRELAVVEPTTTALATELATHVRSARAYADAAVPPNTRRAYEADWRSFAAWCARHRVPALPATPAAVATYLSSLADAGKRSSTVERALSGIAFQHRERGFVWPKGNAVIGKVMKGIRKLKRGAKGKTPVGAEELRKLVQHASPRDRAILTLGWAGAFRRSELVALNVGDVTDVGAEGLIVRVRASKTDQEGKGEDVGIPCALDRTMCAARAVLEYLRSGRGGWPSNVDGPLFLNPSGKRLHDRTVALIVKRAAKRAGLDPNRFSGHSLRSGLATTAAEHGKTLDAIMRQGRWKKADTALRYVRPATLFRNNAAKGLV